jgi:hypothetical protein
MEWLYVMPRTYPCQSGEPRLDANPVEVLGSFCDRKDHQDPIPRSIAAHPDRTELWRSGRLFVRLAAGMLPAAYCAENTSSTFRGVLPPPSM